MPVIRHLTGAAYGTHFADQLALVAVPLVAALALNATPASIGLLVACQSMAHLLGSIPFGILADQRQLRHLAITSATVSLIGFACAALSIGFGSVLGFGASVTLAGFGVVLFGLTALSIVPRAASAEELGRANASIEVPRAACSFIVPLTVGLVISDVPGWAIFLVACLGSTLALRMSWSLPSFEVKPTQQEAVVSKILLGAKFVLRHRLLLPISLCAIFWNFAFAALLVVLVPAIQDLFGFEPGSFGISLSAFGLGAICGTWLSGRLANLVAPAFILLFGPGTSAMASGGLLLLGPGSSVFVQYALFFLLGFGPSMWLIAQNSVRQLMTPTEMLGRVNAVIQTAIYGIRPLGAIAGGYWVTLFGVEAGLQLVVGAFVLSFLVSAFSDLRRVSSYGALAAEGQK
ncbi:MFS transporter [Cognatiyoonia sp. IB215446]|uniref:MFS transporter n=1 Tax=Cognatiyoonia sp. IB215446 TaxID=3097355 RepID=UPI002A0F6CBF|nr:MFS transporter [Cognatiyoonia sp. IB215446]MDX8350469.1 MFS transporter [Cognatiyoonia sp. IB215446]